jgi:hypothetical protein
VSDEPGIASLRSIVSNYDHLSNWLTAIATAGMFAGLASVYDKLTGAAVLVALFTSTALAMVFWPIMLEKGYGNLSWTLLFGVTCGLAGATVLHSLIFVIRRRISKQIDTVGDTYLGKEGGS